MPLELSVPPNAPVDQPPLRVDRDTWLVRAGPGETLGPWRLVANSLVIRGQEPVVVDTGAAVHRERWLTHTFSLVDPGDVRWIFVSHADPDHAGNLEALLAACPRAVLVASRLTAGRLDGTAQLPGERCRWVDDGESFSAGDRALVAMTPPLFDAPGTLGLYDTRSGVYWAADCFAIPDPGTADDCADLAPAAWSEALLAGGHLLSPWCRWLDDGRWGAHVDRVESLGIDTLASAHAPLVPGPLVDAAFRSIRDLPQVPAGPGPGLVAPPGPR